MITLSFTVDNINTVMTIYDQIRIQRNTSEDFTGITSILDTITLLTDQTNYTAIDSDGTADHWYRSQYYNTTTLAESGWSDPVLGEPGDLFYNPLFPPEVSYGTEDQRIIDRIRILLGDPLNLSREYGEDAASSIHPDNRTYELDRKGWPVSITMAGISMNDSIDPSINGYRYLRFDQDISITTYSGGVTYGVDIWYYNFRFSDREIMEAYDNCPPPGGLNFVTANQEAYMLATAIDLLNRSLIEDAAEDGAVVTDEGSRYDPSPGLQIRRDRIRDLEGKLEALIKRLLLGGISGVLLD